uniref:Uncharacterized protein n=1 Tax=Onchocerca volvulus TaxID=6282 RepID=A0A8R1TX69_ONCVO
MILENFGAISTSVLLAINTPWRTTSQKRKFFGFEESMLQSQNLKKLMEGHHQDWSLRLKLTQHEKTHLARTV